MLIPQGDWVVVMRPVRHADNTRGIIIKGSLTEKQAKDRARQHRDTPNFNYWAMPRSSY